MLTSVLIMKAFVLLILTASILVEAINANVVHYLKFRVMVQK